MSSPAERALIEARKRGAEGLVLERVDRIANDEVLLTFRSGKGRRWMRFEGGRIETLSLQRDAGLPIAARLERIAADGPLEVLAYQPGRRLVLRQDTENGTQVLKAYRRKRFQGALQRQATATLAVEGSLFRVPRITGRDDALAYFAMRDLGRNKLLLGRLSPEWFARVGQALRVFQRLTPDIELPVHGLAEELAVLDRAADNASYLTGALPARWASVRALIGRAAADLRPRRPVLTHRDFHDGQLVCTQHGVGEIGLLDFDLLCRADPCLDLANLSTHLELRALQELPGVTSERAREWSSELCAGHGTQGSDAHLRFYTAATFLRLALVYHLRPPWAQLGPELALRAERSLEEVHHRVV